MVEVRPSPHPQPFSDPFQGHCRFRPQTDRQLQLFLVSFAPGLQVGLLPPQTLQTFPDHLLSLLLFGLSPFFPVSIPKIYFFPPIAPDSA